MRIGLKPWLIFTSFLMIVQHWLVPHVEHVEEFSKGHETQVLTMLNRSSRLPR